MNGGKVVWIFRGIITLLNIKWWDWSIEKIEKNIDVITGNDLDALIGLKKNDYR